MVSTKRKERVHCVTISIQSTSDFEFTNIKCTSLDKDFDDFEYCHLKSVNRTFKHISVKVRMYKIPVTKVKVSLKMVKYPLYDPPFQVKVSTNKG